LLAYNFNKLLCLARTQKFDYLLIQHGDVEPLEAHWVDQLVMELEKFHADVVAAVLPLKNSSGTTSTAIAKPREQWRRTRLTLPQCEQLPPTFCANDIQTDAPVDLLVNTGLMLIDLRNPWGASEAYFTICDRVENDEPECEPEDWFVSRLANAAGARVYATRVVHCLHHGDVAYRNWIDDGPQGIITE
jgi:hypothetical protein